MSLKWSHDHSEWQNDHLSFAWTFHFNFSYSDTWYEFYQHSLFIVKLSELKLDVLVNPIKEGQGLLYIDNQILVGLASLIYNIFVRCELMMKIVWPTNTNPLRPSLQGMVGQW